MLSVTFLKGLFFCIKPKFEFKQALAQWMKADSKYSIAFFQQRVFSVKELAFIKLDKKFSSRVELKPNLSRLTPSFLLPVFSR
jgi:hypothetical protein